MHQIASSTLVAVSAFCLSWPTALPAAGKECLVNTTLRAAPPLSSDVAAFIHSHGVSVALVRIVHLQAVRQFEGNLEVESGQVAFQLIETLLAPEALPATFSVRMRRITDPLLALKNGVDEWNMIEIAEGGLVLLATKPTSEPSIRLALAARGVKSERSPEVVAAERACAIEKLESKEMQRERLLDALASKDDVLWSYATSLLLERVRFDRGEAARMVARVMASPATAPEASVKLAPVIGDLFTGETPSDQIDQLIVRTLARATFAEQPLAQRLRVAAELRACLFSEHALNEDRTRQARLALVRSIANPNPHDFIALLTSLLKTVERSDRKDLNMLLDLWRQSVAARK